MKLTNDVDNQGQLDRHSRLPLDKTMPKKATKTIKVLELPDYDKWFKYDRKYIVPFTINPADYSGGSSPWVNLTVRGKRRRIIQYFKKYDNIFSDYYIAYEFGEKHGRFHCHGMLYIKETSPPDFWYFKEDVKNTFGKGKKKNVCFKGTPLNSHSDETFDRCFNYCTKDILVMFKSLWKIKWTDKTSIEKVKKKKIKIRFLSNLLDPPEI